MGGAYVCVAGIDQDGACSGTSTMPPDFIADVNFDIPGILTANFSPALNGSETLSAVFTPVPEPATALFVLLGLALVATPFALVSVFHVVIRYPQRET